MRSIWKYHVLQEDRFAITMPAGAEVLCVQPQGSELQLWALVDTNALREERWFRTYGTGHPFAEVAQRYVGTYQLLGGRLVFHLFEELEQ